MADTSKTKHEKKRRNIPSRDQVIEAAFAMIAEKGLGRLRLSILAKQFGLSLSTFRMHYPSVEAILDSFIDHIDEDMLENVRRDDGAPKRDLYFEMLMSRFDSLQMHRAGVVRWLNDLPKYPALWCRTMQRWDRSLSLMLDMAYDSPLLPLKKIGIAGIYAASLRVWLNDDSPDLDKTMVAVDRYLEKGGIVVSRFMSPKKQA